MRRSQLRRPKRIPANDWRVTGTVGDFSGFGVWWALRNGTTPGYPSPAYASGTIDVSAYAGIQFDVLGDPGPLGVLTLAVESANQQSPSVDPTRANCGTCDPDAGGCDVGATARVFGLTSALRTVQIRWSDMTTAPGPVLDPTNVTSISWFFAWTPGDAPYPVDVTLSNLRFIESPGLDAGGD